MGGRDGSGGRLASDRPPRRVDILRLVHPFPSLVDGLLVGGIVVVAGGAVDVAARLGAAMTLIQFGIGAANDVLDAPFDQARRGKPIPTGQLSRAVATLLAVGCLVAGMALSVPSGPLVLAVAIAGAAAGLAYDVRLKRTPWAWVPFAIGIPLLPVYGWLGATGGLPGAFLVLVPAAALAGAAIALGNGLVDPEVDHASGATTPAVRLGTGRAWRLTVGLYGLVLLLAFGTLPWLGAIGPGVLLAGLGTLILVGGLGLARAPSVGGRERGWELQAVGIAVVAIGWAAAVASGGG